MNNVTHFSVCVFETNARKMTFFLQRVLRYYTGFYIPKMLHYFHWYSVAVLAGTDLVSEESPCSDTAGPLGPEGPKVSFLGAAGGPNFELRLPFGTRRREVPFLGAAGGPNSECHRRFGAECPTCHSLVPQADQVSSATGALGLPQANFKHYRRFGDEAPKRHLPWRRSRSKL